jgi:integrase-like protein
MKSARGLGNVYQPTYRDKHGELKTTSTWWIVYHVNGRRIAENAHSTNRAEAVRLLKSRLSDAAAGKPIGPTIDRTTLDDLLAMVEADYRANSRRSLDRARQAFTHLRAFFRVGRKARDITPDLITRYAAQRLEYGARASTVNYEMSILRRGYRLAIKNGKVGARPEISMLHVNNARKGFFESEQYRAVLFHLPDYLEPIASVGYITGWRVKSEVLTRQWRAARRFREWVAAA